MLQMELALWIPELLTIFRKNISLLSLFPYSSNSFRYSFMICFA